MLKCLWWGHEFKEDIWTGISKYAGKHGSPWFTWAKCSRCGATKSRYWYSVKRPTDEQVSLWLRR